MLAGLGAATGGSAACVPLNDLDDYAPAAAGAGAAPNAAGSAGTTANTPPGSSSGAGGSGAAGAGSSGSGAGGSASGGSGTGPGGTPGAGADGSGTAGDGATPFADAGNPSSADAATPASACAAGELQGPDARCFFLDSETQTFFAARSACQARGSGWDLASVRSAEVSAFLGEALTFDAWLLASDVASEGNWVWLDDGSPFWQGGTNGAPVGGAYTNWNATEPNGGNLTNCMRALPRSAGSANPDAPWADLTCTAQRGSICQGPLE